MNRKRYDNCPRCNKPCIGLTENCQVSKEQLIEQIYTALTDLYINEMYLIKVHVNEVCLSSYFWYYFKLRNQKCYTGLNIDPE